MHNLRIGVPSKGRLSDLAGELLKQAGLSFRRQERSLFARVGEAPGPPSQRRQRGVAAGVGGRILGDPGDRPAERGDREARFPRDVGDELLPGGALREPLIAALPASRR